MILSRLLVAALCAGLLFTSVASLTHRHEARSVRGCDLCLHARAPLPAPSSDSALAPPEFFPWTHWPEFAATECDPLLSSNSSRAPPA